MQIDPAEVIQSFRLRFWREPSHGARVMWRGDVWHEQQNPGDEAVVFADPEKAFELIIKKLHGISQSPVAMDSRNNEPNEQKAIQSESNSINLLLRFARRFWCKPWNQKR